MGVNQGIVENPTILTLASLVSTDVVSTVEIESVNRQTPPIERMMPPPGFVEIAPGRCRITAYPLELMRERYGNSVLIGDIEPYPAITKEEIIWWIEKNRGLRYYM